MPEWTIRRATLADRDAAVSLMDRAFGPAEHRAALWDWAFAENPYTSELYYRVADTGTALAAQYAALPVSMQHEGRVIRGLLSLFTATDPAFRGRGLFRTLAESLYDDTRETCPLVFGFPNQKSAPGLYSHLGWVDLRPYPHLRRPLRNSGHHPAGSRMTAAAARLLEAADRIGRDKEITVTLVPNFTGIADELWDKLRAHAGTAIVRDETFLNWRFVQSPFPYLRLVARRGTEPVGLAVVSADNSNGKARLMEFMVAPEEKLGVSRTLLARAVELASGSGAYGLGFIATPRHPQRRAMIASGLLPTIPLPARRLPIEPGTSSFGARVNGPGVIPSKMLHIDDWYLSGADQDWL
jgi:GNAT superfamily N-acetyltransferase